MRFKDMDEERKRLMSLQKRIRIGDWKERTI